MWEKRPTTENNIGGARNTALGKANGSDTILKTMESGSEPLQVREEVPSFQAK